MSRTASTLLILSAGAALAFFSAKALPQKPLVFFVLKEDGANLEAFQVPLAGEGGESQAKTIVLGDADRKKAGELIAKKNEEALRAFAAGFGKFAGDAVVTGEKSDWPSFLGGGVKSLLQSDSPGSFDDLGWMDRLYLAATYNPPPPPPFEEAGSTAPAPAPTPMGTGSAAPPAVTPTTVPFNGLLRVEILNGCGITNAADWAARRIKGPGIIISGTGNADHFHYAKTVVRTSAGIPVALEEALDRMGLGKDAVEESAGPDNQKDVVVIVGRDFRQLKERLRERRHQRPE